MPIPFSYELRGASRESQNDVLQLGVFALPDLKTVLEELLNLRIARSWFGKLIRRLRDMLYSGKHKDPACVASPIIAEQIPLARDADQMPGFDRSFFKGVSSPATTRLLVKSDGVGSSGL